MFCFSFFKTEILTFFYRFWLVFLCVFSEILPASDSFDKNPHGEKAITRTWFQEQADTFYLLSERAVFQNKKATALEFLKEALFYKGESAYLRGKLAGFYTQEGLSSQAFFQYQAILKRDSKNQEARFRLAKLYKERGLYKEALAAYNLLLAQSPQDFTFGFEKALAYREAGLYPQALSQINKIFSLKGLGQKEKVWLYLLEAHLYKLLKKPLLQKKVLLQAVALNPVKKSLIRGILAHYMDMGNIKEARDYLLNYQEKNDPSVYVARVLGEISFILNEKESLYHQLKKIQALDTLSSFESFQLASLLVEKKQYPKAIPFFFDLLKEGEFVSESHYFLGLVHEERKKTKKARKYYQKVHSSNRYFFAARTRLAYLLKKEGQWEQALGVVTNLKTQFKENPLSFLVHAQFLKDDNRFHEALEILSQAENLFPENIEVLFLKGFYLEENGNIPLALETMKKVLQKDPNHVRALNFLAYAYARHKGPLERAEQMARKAFSLNPESGYVLDTLGWVLYKRGHSKKALIYVKRAFEKKSQESIIAEHLGEIYRTLKEYEKSAFYFKTAASLEKNKIKSASLKRQSELVQARL